MNRSDEPEGIVRTLVIVTSGREKQWARADEMEAQRGARPSLQKAVLQKSLRPKPCDWIDYYLPLENPAGHRKANRRIKQMHLSHLTPPYPDQSQPG
jgi:hypothetical protein